MRRCGLEPRTRVAGGVALFAVAVLLGGCEPLATPTAGSVGDETPVPPHSPEAAPAGAEELAVPPPPFSEGIYPCSDCHEGMTVNYERRKLEDEHESIRLDHGPKERWCLDCHNPEGRDQLRLASGALVPFTESYRLCGQCHGPKLRDWRVGVHGKRMGEWDGKKSYLLCAHCHDPHSPRFKPVPPMPPPVRPSDLR